ncbi:MAG TPA: O-acetyl-ADP-ribose deacetylase [Propionibacteriaceae bacterium]|nr:O-acetyl-ADP-ribose deacetylase [Propionibacteriaceae bacterium]
MAPRAPSIDIVRADITTLQVDAVVNAANSTLLGGGGVDGAIHRAGGPEILAACRQVRRELYPGGLPVGEAVATTGGRLPARWVIHTVGPVYSGRPRDADLLASCYRSSLAVADDLGATGIAFPTISAGVYGYPMDEATSIAVETILAAVTRVERVLLVAFGRAAEEGYGAALSAATRE